MKESTVKDFVKALKSENKKTSAYDTTAKVTRIDGDTVWVHIAGGVDETPVKRTISAKAGDTVQVRVGGGNAWLTGNQTAPPTDDEKAEKAHTVATKAESKAENAQESADIAMESALVAKEASENAIGFAESAQESAESARTKADEASAEATRAKETADSVAGIAQAAQESASTAQSAANQALADAETANTAANQAVVDAANANTAANNAGRAAEIAQAASEASIEANYRKYNAISLTQTQIDSLCVHGSINSWDRASAEGYYQGACNVGDVLLIYVTKPDTKVGKLLVRVTTASNAGQPTTGETISWDDNINVYFWHDTEGAHVLGDTYRTDVKDGLEVVRNSDGTVLADINPDGATFKSGNGTEIAHLGYGTTQGESGQTTSPYYDLGVRKSGTRKGAYSVAEGFDTTAGGSYSHAEGQYTTATGLASHSEGNNTTASGWYSHAEGCDTTASEYASHAEGRDTTAIGEHSHAEGSRTTTGCYLHTADDDVIAGMSSHAEGGGTTTIGDYSHAEGYGTIAGGYYLHTPDEQEEYVILGSASHAEGHYTTAISDYSHAEGEYTTAKGQSQHVQGKYNVEDNNDTYADIVGNGTGLTARSNAYALEWNGTGRYKGDVYVGCSADSTGGTKLAKISEIPTSMAWSSITGKPSTFTPSSHTHTKAQITDYSAPSVQAVQWTDVSCNANSYKQDEKAPPTVAGKTAIGVVGFTSNKEGLVFGFARISGGNVGYRVRNVTSSKISGATITLYVLYV